MDKGTAVGMRWRLRHGTGLAAAAALALSPLVSASSSPVVDAAPQPSAGWTDLLPNLPEVEGLAAQPPVPQGVEPQTTLVARGDRGEVRVEGPRGSRVWTASALASHDLPQAAMAAYKAAAATLAAEDPACALPWTLLAGIGRVESDHGRYGGSVLGSDAVARPAIIGVALNGAGPVAAIRDTDDGELDRDDVWDRAVGPMQFIPTTWAYAGRDGDRDGRKNPHDLDDAALAAAGYLCSGSGSMLVDPSAKAAIFRYNPSDYYVALVQAFERGYRTGVFVIPSPPAPDEKGERRKKKRADRDREAADAGATRSPRPAQESTTSKPSPKPPQTPSPKPSPSPTTSPSPSSPSPSSPSLVALNGALTTCGDSWCVGATTLDLGPLSQLAAEAAHDYDGSGAVGTNREELDGLVGRSVSLRVGSGSGAVYVIDGRDYRFADGTFA